MSIVDQIADEALWNAFFLYKKENQHLSYQEEQELSSFIATKQYLSYLAPIKKGCFPSQLPKKVMINKKGTTKKRVVYTFAPSENIILKFIAHQLYAFDDVLSPNCYAFRRYYGIGHALVKFKNNPEYSNKYCYKADIHNYFNSISIDLLLTRLLFLKERDEELYDLFSRILKEDRVLEQGTIITDAHGAMAGTPIAPFFANIYLRELDALFLKNHISYYRYSDDILFFADTAEELANYITLFQAKLHKLQLEINPAKVEISAPGESWSFLGFSYQNGEIDLSNVTKEKIKSKIKRKAHAIMRWQRGKGLPPEKAAIGFIHAMNRKFFGYDAEDEFTWNRWYFPHLTVSTGLHEIDKYMQQYIRYIITGRHYKGNYRISYDQLKAWGYKSLVTEYYKG